MPKGIYIRTIQARKNMSASKSGDKHPLWGKHVSMEVKKRMRDAQINKYIPLETRIKMSKSKVGNKNGLGNKSSLGYHHTEEARRKIGDAHKGEKCIFWKNGISLENEKIRHNFEMRIWRESVFARDYFICCKCCKTGGDLQAHHIKNFSQHPELRTSIENGITFCVSCHKKFHKIYGQQNNDIEQIYEFIDYTPYEANKTKTSNLCQGIS